MGTKLILNDELVEKARQATGIRQMTALVHAGLEALIQGAAAQRLMALGSTMPDLKTVPRRRSSTQ
jgi:hypothetical protein